MKNTTLLSDKAPVCKELYLGKSKEVISSSVESDLFYIFADCSWFAVHTQRKENNT